MYEYAWYHWITFFFLYSFFGWIFESGFVSIQKRHFVNRGFLRLPMLPLYGTGAIVMLWVSLPVRNSVVLIFLSGVVGATALEFVTGYVMERLFKIKYWDYSNQKFNYKGYICLSSSIAWGFLTIFLTEVVHRPVAELVCGMSPWVEIPIICVVGVAFIVDTVISVKEALNLGRMLETMTKMKAELDELQLQLATMRGEIERKVSGLREDAVLRVADAKADAAAILSEAKAEAASRVAELKEDAETFIQDHRMSEQAISKRIQAISEKREALVGHMNFYRRDLLRGNPTASSGRFSAALKELRESLGDSYVVKKYKKPH